MSQAAHIDLRLPRESDLASITILIRTTFTVDAIPGWTRETLQTIYEENEGERLRKSVDSAAHACVAMSGEETVGYIHFSRPHLLAIIAIDPKMQGRGLGSNMLERAISEVSATNPDTELLQLSATERSEPFYSKHGFYPISPMLDVEGRRFVRMALWLRPRRLGWLQVTGRKDGCTPSRE